MMSRPPLSLAVAAAAAAVSQPATAQGQDPDTLFDLGTIVVIGDRPDGRSSVGGSVVTREQNWTFQTLTLDQSLALAPGVNSTPRGRRNEYDIFVRGFDRLQVPLMIDGVRIYLPADNRIDFGRFLTADIAAVQIQKGYVSVLDGPGAMGGAINLVTGKPAESLEIEAGVSAAGRSGVEDTNGYLIGGSRQERYYVQGSVTFAYRDSWTLSGDYVPPPGSLEDGGERIGSNTQDARLNFKLGFTPNDTDEYALNYMRQEGEKGTPLNVYNNPPVPRASFWIWPYWDVENTSFLTSTTFSGFRLTTKSFYNSFENGLSSYDDISYTTQNLPFAFDSPYDDHAYGTRMEFATTGLSRNTVTVALHYRADVHTEQQTSRPTNPALTATEPVQEQAQDTWSVAVENRLSLNSALEIVVGASYDEYAVTKAEEFDSDLSPDIFEYPKGGADAVNWQAAVIYRYADRGQFHASVSDRGRFPTFFERYSTRFGTATPNPELGPERATNFELGWERMRSSGSRIGGALFYNDVEDLVQTVVLPDASTQAQNVGNGRFYGLEVFFEARVADSLTVGGNYTHIDRKITDALQPDLRPDGVPDNKAFVYAAWRPAGQFTFTPSLEAADDRWSNVNANPQPAFPYVRTGAYTVLNIDADYRLGNNMELALGVRNLLDDNYELAWGFPQPGRSMYLKLRASF